MMDITWRTIAKDIYEAVFNAILEGYYGEYDLERPNYMEIREWVGLNYVDPNEPNYSADDKAIDDYITDICLALKKYIASFPSQGE